MTVDWLSGISGMIREGFIALGSRRRRSKGHVFDRFLLSAFFCSILELHSYAVKMERGGGGGKGLIACHTVVDSSCFFYSTQVPLLWKLSFGLRNECSFCTQHSDMIVKIFSNFST